MLDERIPNLDVDPHGSIFLGEKKPDPILLAWNFSNEVMKIFYLFFTLFCHDVEQFLIGLLKNFHITLPPQPPDLDPDPRGRKKTFFLL